MQKVGSAGRSFRGVRRRVGECVSSFLCMNPVQVGESFESCAKRELAEETGISSVSEAMVLPFTSNDIMQSDGLHYVTVFVALTVAADATAAMMETSHHEWRWSPLDQIPEPTFASLRALLDSGVLGNKS